MARSGRFGNLPGRAPDLTNTIVALLEQYESARDRNILNAWLNGGKFEGKSVTDNRIRNWFKSRRNQYGKDDPEYDYWDQQLRQVDYQIGESKMLLSYEQGKIAEGGAAAWYTKNAGRFPKNSEAWREAMRNAARFKKAATEKSRAASTVSKSERYDNAQQRIYRQKIAPAEEAIAIWEEALLANRYAGQGGFLGLSPEDMAGDEDMQRFLTSKKGRQFRREWEKTTGRPWSFKAFRRVVRTAKEGYNEMADVARRFGYESYVPGFKSAAREKGDYHTQLTAYNQDIYDRYLTLKNQYEEDIANADGPKERNRIRRRYTRQLDKLGNRSQRIGDNALAGSLRREADAVSGKDFGSNTAGNLAEGGRAQTGRQQTTADDLNYVEQKFEDGRTLTTGTLDTSGLSSLEIEMQQAIRDQEAEDGLNDGSWVWMRSDEGKLVAIPRASLVEFYGGDDFVGAGAKVNFKRNPDGTTEQVIIIPTQAYMVIGGERIKMEGVSTYTTVNGQTRFLYTGPDGQTIDSIDPPGEGLHEFHIEGTPGESGTISWQDENGVWRTESVYSTNEAGDVVLSDRYVAYVRSQAEVEKRNQIARDKEVDPSTVSPEDYVVRGEELFIAVSNAVIEADWVEQPDGSFALNTAAGFQPVIVEEANPDYVAPLRERLETMTPAEIKEALTPEQWDQFLAVVDATIPGSSRAQKLLEFNRNSNTGTGSARDEVITSLYEDPDIALFGGTEDPEVAQAAVTARQSATEEDIEWLMMNNVSSGDRVLTLRQTVDQWGADTPEGQAAQEELNDIRGKAEGIAESNINSGVTARGEVITRTEDDDFGYAGDIVDPGEVAQTAFGEGTDGEVGSPTRTRVIEVPTVYVISDTGSTTDDSGILAQFQGPLGRAELAGYSPEEVEALIDQIVVANGEENNPSYRYAVAGEVDALRAVGEHGGSEEEYNMASGALSDDEKFRLIQGARYVANARTNDYSAQEAMEPSLLSELRGFGLSDEQIGEQFPELLEEERLRDEDAHSILPGPYDSTPGDYSSIDGGTTPTPVTTAPPSRGGILGVDAAIREAKAAYGQANAPTPKATPPSTFAGSSVPNFKPVTTVRGSVPVPGSQPPVQTPEPTAAPQFGTSNFLPNPTYTTPGDYSFEGPSYTPPPPTSSPPPAKTPAYRQPSFRPPGIR